MVLCHLAKGEKSVGELAALTGLRMAAVSQNLAVLPSGSWSSTATGPQ
jgi:DNA-binding transcriptional ArsR family regulator